MENSIARSLQELGLAGTPVCLHASLRSFARLADGPKSVIMGFLIAECTLMVPTFSWRFAVQPSPSEILPRNAWQRPRYSTECRAAYTSQTAEVDRDMGAISAAVAAWPGRVRSGHPLCSFSAIGPLARELVETQAPEEVWRPLEILVGFSGSVVLAGVGFEALTLLHLAERKAGRTPFRRWACVADRRVIRVEVGGCSAGFGGFAEYLASITRRTQVAGSTWLVLPAGPTLERAIMVINADPTLTGCSDPDCERCHDAIAGGPILPDVDL
jgi:aminoglycoside 3-N-acetyltransferase